MSVRIVLGGFLVATSALALPARADDGAKCERAIAKASAKFVDASLKSVQRCLALRRGGVLPGTACGVTTASTGHRATDRSLSHAEARLRRGTRACSDGSLAGLGYEAACATPSAAGFGRDDLERCLSRTHRTGVQAIIAVEFPLEVDDCGNGVVDVAEECDPIAAPSGCDAGETCAAAGSEDACLCVEGASPTCGNGTLDATEQCDPAATPTGCGAGMNCIAAGQVDECTCSSPAGNQCTGTCTPTCTTGACGCTCVSGATCGNGVRETGEQCDPTANPSGCAVNMVCGAPGTATQCTCTTSTGPCGNGTLDPGENCDPALPNTCDPGEVCLSTGANACTCGAPPANCGNGLVEWGEQCDPAAVPTGCAAGQTCGTACTCDGSTTTTTTPGGTTTTGPGGTTTTSPGGTTTTIPGGGGGTFDFTTGPPDLSGCVSGETKDGSGATLKMLHCGGLNIGGGPSTVVEGATPEGATSRFTLTCTGNDCTLGPTAAAGPGFECTNTGCNFGPPLPIANAGTSTCVLNTWAAPASGTVNLATGESTTSVPLNSNVFLTGNAAAPCPRCQGGTCERGPNAGAACTTTNAFATSKDCPPDGTNLGAIAVDLTPLTTGTANKTNASGNLCPGQDAASNPPIGAKTGCFGSAACTTVEERGTPAGALAPGTAAPVRLASVFCVPETPGSTGQLINLAAGLPGPGATSLPGTVTVNP
jgi:mucin-2